jgi:hypothetical protein
MNKLEKLQAICDNALQVAEKSGKAQNKTICALVMIVGKMIDLNSKHAQVELNEKAANYALLLRQGHNVNKLLLAQTIEDLIMRNSLDKVA